MSPTKMLISLAIVALYAVQSEAGESLARGFNDNIDWKNLEDGLEIAKKENKMVVLLIHKTWCGACKALKTKFGVHTAVEEEAKNFVMINVQDDEEPNEEQYKPDGGYIPRLLFLNAQGKVLTEKTNPAGNPSYKYYYSDPDQVVASMKSALLTQGGGSEEEKKKEL